MNITLYDQITSALNEKRNKIISTKRPEYTEGNEDVLNNFKVVAKELGCSSLQVWYVYFRKHIMSISQFCSDPNRQLSEPIEERICDGINYLELLNGLINELTITEVNTASAPHAFIIGKHYKHFCHECGLPKIATIHV